jgi:xanthine dehydrogenase accessory factor
MKFDFFETIERLRDQGQPFVIATVVRSEKPTSAKPGAKAVISADGVLTGWIGGSCAEPTVKREARKALEDGQTRLVRLCPPERRDSLTREGVVEVPMTCISGGTLEIFIEPQMVQPHLILVGHQAIVQALTTLGKDLGYIVTVMGLDCSPENFPEADQVFTKLDFSPLIIKANTYIIVASHGNYDEDALLAALQTNASYVALVASKRRAQALYQYLRDSSLSEDHLNRLKVPAGLDLGAITPEEIALSILAEIIQLQHRGKIEMTETVEIKSNDEEPALEARDPVCGMMVEIASAHYVTQYKDRTYYFCAKGCQRSFEAEPERYLAEEGKHGR